MAQPERYGFFQAARLLFRTHGLTDLRAGGRAAVRFGVIASLSFPPGEITALQPAPEQVAAELRLTVAFLGLTGRSEERSVGTDVVRHCNTRLSPYPLTT